MRSDDATRAAETMIDELGLADPDTDPEYYRALAADEHFGAVAYCYQEVSVYATADGATAAEREAGDSLKHALREHAQRVALEHAPDPGCQEAGDE